MRHFSIFLSFLVAVTPAALHAQTITFAPPRQITVGSTARDASVYLYGDFEGNGITDLIVEEAPINQALQFKFLKGDGTGKFTPIAIIDLGAQQESLVADFNGDGRDDIVTLEPGCTTVPCSGRSGRLRILVSEGKGKFHSGYSASLPASDNAVIAVVADFNKDGKLDIAVVNYPFFESAPANLMIFINQGEGSFRKTTYSLPQQFAAFDFLSDLVAGDFEGNGNLDLAFASDPPTVSNYPCQLYTFAGNGRGNFGFAQLKYSVDTSCFVGSGALFAADLNGDSRTDLVPIVGPKNSNLNTRVPSLLARTSGSFFWSSAVYVSAVNAPGFLLADLNGDGVPDLIFVSLEGNENQQNLPAFGGIYTGLGNGAFQTPHIPISITGNNTITHPSVAAAPLKTGDLPSLFIGNGAPTIELLINTTQL